VCTTPEGVPCRALRGNNNPRGTELAAGVRPSARSASRKKIIKTTDRLKEPRFFAKRFHFPELRAR
jgi:hypothetical protein